MELRHFCLQYPDWKKELAAITFTVKQSQHEIRSNPVFGDPTSFSALKRLEFELKIEMVERAAHEADEAIYEYLMVAVTEGKAYTYLKTVMNIPCGKDYFYDKYRRFFYILDKLRK